MTDRRDEAMEIRSGGQPEEIVPADGAQAPLSGELASVGDAAADAPESRNPLALHMPDKKTGLINPVVLAYMGDAVFELLVRQYLISLPNNKSHHLHSEATKRVSAKAQRALLERLQPLLTEEEADIARRGRNAKSGTPPKNADPADYRQATALECLFGYLYFEGRMERIGVLMRVALET
ncbi:MAG: ribonuclease [Paenibacillus sp.]|nr:ribonuclease [Paenibacillus sp.]